MSDSKEESDTKWLESGHWARGKESTATAGANSLTTGLDDKAIESKIGALVREGAQ